MDVYRHLFCRVLCLIDFVGLGRRGVVAVFAARSAHAWLQCVDGRVVVFDGGIHAVATVFQRLSGL